MKELLNINNVSYSYHSLAGETKAIDQLTFQAYEGEFLAIVGPSGCGNAML